MRPIRIAITTGDSDGIGPEVTAKALNSLKLLENVILYLWRSPNFRSDYLNLIDRSFNRKTVTSWHEALSERTISSKLIIDIKSTEPPPTWVETSAHACMEKHMDAIVTAPLSKTTIRRSGFKDIGHTEILKRVAGTKNVYMTFLGKKFNVLLLTGHVPLNHVSSLLNKEVYLDALKKSFILRKDLKEKFRKKPIALLGLNPHSGEEGLIGSEENIIKNVLSEFDKELLKDIRGPLVPDAAFLKDNWDKYSIFLCTYHDQGLIPFKMAHKKRGGVHLSLGLPFIRTSVDHGTAKDIFGKEKADYTSMKNAIKWAVRLVNRKVIPVPENNRPGRKLETVF